MTYYDSFDTKIQCEEFFTVDESEINDYQRLDEWLENLEPTEQEAFLEQQAIDAEQERLKTNFDFNPPDEGDYYGAIAV